MRQGNINRDDPLMSNIGQVNLASAGILKTTAFIVISPLLGLLWGSLLMLASVLGRASLTP